MKVLVYVEKVVDHCCRKTKKLVCGTEGEIVVAHGPLPSLAPCAGGQMVIFAIIT